MVHFPSTLKQYEVFQSKGLGMPLPSKCGKTVPQKSLSAVLESITCKQCQSKIFPPIPKGV